MDSQVSFASQEILKGEKSNHDRPLADLKTENQDKKTSCEETLMHMIKANIGPGLLSIPLAMKNAGYIFGTFGLWFMGAVCLHCIHILLKGYKQVAHKLDIAPGGSVGYDDVVYTLLKEHYGPNSKIPQITRYMISFFLVVTQLGTCTVYFVFIPRNIEQVIEHYTGNNFSIKTLMCIMLGPIILYCMIRNLKYLAPFSAFANVLMITSVVIILYDLFFGVPKPFSELEMIAPVKNWPSFFSSAVFAFEGIGCVLPIYHGMKDKEYFTPINGVLNTAITLVAIMFYSTGFFGYLKYGSDCAGSITLNLPVDNVVFQGVKLCIALAVFITFNLQFMIGCDILWMYLFRSISYLQYLSKPNHLLGSESINMFDQMEINNPVLLRMEILMTKRSLLYVIESSFRTFMIIVTFLLAYFVPKIDLFIGLIGAMGSSILAIIIPMTLDIIIYWPRENYPKTKLIKIVLLLIFGVYVFTAGTYKSLYDIIDYLMNGDGE